MNFERWCDEILRAKTNAAAFLVNILLKAQAVNTEPALVAL